jgi:dihydroorotate dehydrogenase electron transfer subunit
MDVAGSCQTLPGLVPSATQCAAVVEENELLARDTWRMRLRCPEIARQILPGQFFMIRDQGAGDPMLGRPFALLDVWDEAGEPGGVDFGYLVIGKLTGLMASWSRGDRCDVWGPLGNGFPIPTARRLCMVAGGIGQTPFLAVAREATGARVYGSPSRSISQPPDSIELCYGVRSKEYLAGVELFRETGIDVRLATDDGSAGHSGFVTELLSESLEGESPPDAVYCCGPEPMMEAVAKISAEAGVSCWLSLETPMACGFGICFSCVTRVRMDDGTWDYRRTCVEGPVFPAEKLCLS